MYRLSSFLLFLCSLLSFGCSQNQALKDSWKYSKHQYYSYINTPATLDLNDNGKSETYERALGSNILDVDTRISQLQRAMENADSNPNQEWVLDMLNQFNWLSTVALVGVDGKVEAKYPEHTVKEFDITPLLESDPKQAFLDLRVYAQMSPLGAEVYVAKPIYMESGLRGFVVVSFDPQSLVISSSNATNTFAMISSYGLLWNNSNIPREVIDEDWKTILKSSSSGIINHDNTRYFWTTHYLGNMPIVYTIPLVQNAVEE